jgi:hypothetical protein
LPSQITVPAYVLLSVLAGSMLARVSSWLLAKFARVLMAFAVI